MTHEDFQKLKQIGEIELTDWVNTDGTPVRVAIYLDEAKDTAYQYDRRNERYRRADARVAARYGDWNKL
jgi:hypothetical protein